LFVENCAIAGFNGGNLGQGIGIKFASSGLNAELYVKDSVISSNGRAADGGGIVIQPPSTASAKAVIENSQVLNNTFGIFANGSGTSGTISVQVRDSMVGANAIDGISAFTGATGTTSVTVDRSSSVLNGQAGIASQGAAAFVLLAESTVMSNGTGLKAAGGAILSYQNNHLTGNAVDGAPTSVLTVQ
jgi:hypothetical protein